MQPELVVFDMAGTTVQVTDPVPAAFRAALSEVGVQVDDREIASVRGRSKHDAIADLLQRHQQAESVEAVFASFRNHLLEAFEDRGVDEVDGARRTLDWLRARQVQVALTTGFDRTVVDFLIAALGWQQAADTVICGDDVARGRPAPDLIIAAMEGTGRTDPRRVIAVGDTVSDIRAAHNAGIAASIAVLTGAHGRTQLEVAGPTVILPSVADLPDLLDL